LNVGTAGEGRRHRQAGDLPRRRAEPSSQAATAVVVSVRLPNWTEVVSNETQGVATPSTTSPGLIEWQLAEIPARSQEELTLELIPRKSQAFDLAVGWSQQPQTAQATVEVQEPKLKIDIDGPSEVHYGENQVYKLTLSNPGNRAADNVMIHLLPIGQGTEPPDAQRRRWPPERARRWKSTRRVRPAGWSSRPKRRPTATALQAVEEVSFAAPAWPPCMARRCSTLARWRREIKSPTPATPRRRGDRRRVAGRAEFKEVTAAYNADTGAWNGRCRNCRLRRKTMTIKCAHHAGHQQPELTASASGDLSSTPDYHSRGSLSRPGARRFDPHNPVAVGQDVTTKSASRTAAKSADASKRSSSSPKA
jgi:hypothetical protein